MNVTYFWHRSSASVSLLLFSKSIAHASVAEIMSKNCILLVARTKFGPKLSRDICSSVNSVSVKLMTACFIYDIVFCLLFFLELFFNFSDLLIKWLFFFVNCFSLGFSVVRSMSAKFSSFILLLKLSRETRYKSEKSRSHRKLKDQNATVLNRI